MDLDAEYQDEKIRKHKGIRKDDSKQMRDMMHGALDAPDYRERLISNCQNVIHPPFLENADKVIPDRVAVMCAELLGKRRFILEVLPGAAEYLAVDRTKQKKKEKKAWWKLW